jgi:uncharacterized protein DUF5996
MALVKTNVHEWPALPYAAWKDTRDTLQLWTQVIGKIKLVRTPWLNHSWHVVLYVTARGLTTGPIPDGSRIFQIDFDFIDHELWLRTSDGHDRHIMLQPMPVTEFYSKVMTALDQLSILITINTMPNEILMLFVSTVIPFTNLMMPTPCSDFGVCW